MRPIFPRMTPTIETPAGPLLRPPPLEPGDTVGIFTPSAPAHVRFREKYLHGLRQMESLGFRVREGALTARATSQGYRSGTPRERAEELMALVLDPEVRGIVATIGGMNSSSLVPFLDFDAIRAHPKVICGYSDVTALHRAGGASARAPARCRRTASRNESRVSGSTSGHSPKEGTTAGP